MSPAWSRVLLAAPLATALALAPVHARADDPPPDGAPAPPAPPIPAIVPPRLLAPVEAAYPPDAHGPGAVILTITVDPEGRVREARVTQGDEPFATAAVEAVRAARF